MSGQLRFVSRSFVCGFARSRSFRPECQTCELAGRFSGPGCTPTHPFVNSRAEPSRSRAVLGESGTDDISCDRPAGQGRLNHYNVGNRGRMQGTRPSRSTGHLRLTPRRGGKPPRGRSADATVSPASHTDVRPPVESLESNETVSGSRGALRLMSPLLPPDDSDELAADRRTDTVHSSSACATGSSSGGASQPPARSSNRGGA